MGLDGPAEADSASACLVRPISSVSSDASDASSALDGSAARAISTCESLREGRGKGGRKAVGRSVGRLAPWPAPAGYERRGTHWCSNCSSSCCSIGGVVRGRARCGSEGREGEARDGCMRAGRRGGGGVGLPSLRALSRFSNRRLDPRNPSLALDTDSVPTLHTAVARRRQRRLGRSEKKAHGKGEVSSAPDFGARPPPPVTTISPRPPVPDVARAVEGSLGAELFVEQGLVAVLGQELLELGRVGELELEEPACVRRSDGEGGRRVSALSGRAVSGPRWRRGKGKAGGRTVLERRLVE